MSDIRGIYRQLMRCAKELEDNDVLFGLYIVGVDTPRGSSMINYLKTNPDSREHELAHIAKSIVNDRNIMTAIIEKLLKHDNPKIAKAAKTINNNIEYFT